MQKAWLFIPPSFSLVLLRDKQTASLQQVVQQKEVQK